jgi:hypothetical protein
MPSQLLPSVGSSWRNVLPTFLPFERSADEFFERYMSQKVIQRPPGRYMTDDHDAKRIMGTGEAVEKAANSLDRLSPALAFWKRLVEPPSAFGIKLSARHPVHGP